MKTKQLNSGDCIPIIEDTVFFHACCKCGKYHEVHVERVDGQLVTRWFAIDKLPTTEELEERGGVLNDPYIS